MISHNILFWNSKRQDCQKPSTYLLFHTTVILNGENQRIIGNLKGVGLASCDNIFEEDLGGESVSVVDNWLALISIPTINYGEIILNLFNGEDATYVQHSDNPV